MPKNISVCSNCLKLCVSTPVHMHIMGQRRTAHSPVEFFVNHTLCLESAVRFLLCVCNIYTFINEAPGVQHLKVNPSSVTFLFLYHYYSDAVRFWKVRQAESRPAHSACVFFLITGGIFQR